LVALNRMHQSGKDVSTMSSSQAQSPSNSCGILRSKTIKTRTEIKSKFRFLHRAKTTRSVNSSTARKSSMKVQLITRACTCMGRKQRKRCSPLLIRLINLARCNLFLIHSSNNHLSYNRRLMGHLRRDRVRCSYIHRVSPDLLLILISWLCWLVRWMVHLLWLLLLIETPGHAITCPPSCSSKKLSFPNVSVMSSHLRSLNYAVK